MNQRNARYNVLNAVLAAVAFNLINSYVGIFAIKLGADNLQLGYLSSWPQVVSVVAVLGAAAAVARSRSKQRLIAGIFLLGRAAALGLAAVPWYPPQYRVWVLMGFWVLAVFPNSAAGTAQQSFLAGVFRGGERGKAFASRNAWSTGASMVVGIASGWLLDHVFPYPLGYQIIFLASFVFALFEIYTFLMMKEPAEPEADAPDAAKPADVGLRTYLKAFEHKPFLLFLMVSIPFHFTWQLAWPIFTRVQVTDLHADNMWLQIIGVAQSLVAMATYPMWVRLSEKYGNLPMMGVSALYLATAPILTAIVPSIQWLVLVNMFTGPSVSGVTQLVLNSLLEVSPTDGRPVYLAVHSALVSVSASIAPMVGAFLMEALPARSALGLATLPRVVTACMFFVLIYWQRRGKGNASGAQNSSRSKPA